MLVTREDRAPRAKLELPPARSMTLSGPRPKIRSGLGGLRSSSAMSVDREEEPSRGIRHVGGGSVRIKKSSELSIGLILSVSVYVCVSVCVIVMGSITPITAYPVPVTLQLNDTFDK